MRNIKAFVILCSAILPLLAMLIPFGGAAAESGDPPLEVMIGSMIMCGFRGAALKPDDAFLRMVAEGRVGHVILFDRDVPSGGPRNIVSRAQLAELTRTLRAAAHRPMLIAVDQEGGRVCRLKPEYGFTAVPSARVMGLGSPDATRTLARRTGEEMRAAGINADFAPVADVADGAPSVIGRKERSFSGDAERAAEHACAFGRGLMEAGVIPTLKHFPGKGCATDDAHFLRSDISACHDARRDLSPFAAAFRMGWRGMVMTSHVHTAMDARRPATLSSAVINDLLRRRMGWQGVVVSDDLQMQAIREYYPLEQAIRLAVEAGVDILLFGNNLNWQPDMAERAYAALHRLVTDGTIPRERVVTSYKRIRALLAAYADGAGQAP